MLRKTLKNFLTFTTSSEMLLVMATISGLLIANSIYYPNYHSFFTNHINFTIDIFAKQIPASFAPKLFIDDFLMAIFFLLIGLELKREILVGELSSRAKLLLPVIAAIGGVVVPALFYGFFNHELEYNLRGFAIPTATDIAFAYAVVKAFGNKISNSIKVFLISLAVVDDIIAISIIAFFYTDNLQAINLLYSFIVMFCLFLVGAKKSENICIYIALGLVLWIFIFKSGIHPSIAGVVMAMFIPFKTKNKFLLENFAHKISPFVSFVILPIFAFANAGVKISGFSASDLFNSSIIVGIFCGLFFGKQIGVFFFSLLAIKLKICDLPKDARLSGLYGISILTGIGFTMSLFIGNLAFSDPHTIDEVKIAVLIASLASFIYGSFILMMMEKRKNLL